MVNYFLEIKSQDLTGFANVEEIAKLLDDNQVSFVYTDVDGHSGFLIDDENLPKLLELLKIRAIFDHGEESAEMPGVMHIKWKKTDANAAGQPIEENNAAMQVDQPAEKAVVAITKLKIGIEAPSGFRCDHWKYFLDSVKKMLAKDNNLKTQLMQNGISSVSLLEGYNNTRLRSDPNDGELLVWIGRAPNGAQPFREPDFHFLPQQRILAVTEIPECPNDDANAVRVLEGIKTLLPLYLATPEEAAALLAQQPKKIDLRSIGSNSSYTKQIEKILRDKLMPIVDREIVVMTDTGHWGVVPPKDDGKNRFHIYTGAVPKVEGSEKAHAQFNGTILGFSTEMGYMRSSSSTGIDIIDPQSGFSVAELAGENFNHLYFHFQAFRHLSERNSIAVFEKTIDLAAEQLKRNIAELRQEADRPRGRINFHTENESNCHNAQQIVNMIDRLLIPAAQKDVILHVFYDSDNHDPLSDGKFHIWTASSPTGNCQEGNRSKPKKIFGSSTSDWNFFLSSGRGFEIIDEETGFAVAELIDDNLFLHSAFHRSNFPNGLQVIEKIFERTTLVMNLDQEKKDAYLADLKAKRFAVSRENYVKACSQRIANSRLENTNNMAKAEQNIAAYQSRLIEAIRQAEEYRKMAAFFEAGNTEMEDKFREEFATIMAMPEIEDVNVSDKYVNIFTKPIYLRGQCYKYNEGKEGYYDIGKFRIQINTSGTDHAVRFFNLTRKGKGDNYNIHHPHVNSDNVPCLGNIGPTISELIAKYEYAILADILVQFLFSVNYENDTAGMGLFKYWPQVSKKEYDKGMKIDYALPAAAVAVPAEVATDADDSKTSAAKKKARRG